jgi:hypothetical protein
MAVSHILAKCIDTHTPSHPPAPHSPSRHKRSFYIYLSFRTSMLLFATAYISITVTQKLQAFSCILQKFVVKFFRRVKKALRRSQKTPVLPEGETIIER